MPDAYQPRTTDPQPTGSPGSAGHEDAAPEPTVGTGGQPTPKLPPDYETYPELHAVSAVQVDAADHQTPSLEGEPTPHPVLDAEAATGPPWPRLVATDAAYRSPRLLRWPIVAGVVVLAGWVALNVALQGASSLPSSRPPRVFAASDAHFTATFPGRPHRTAHVENALSVVTYSSQLSGHDIVVGFVSLPARQTLNLDGAITGAAAAVKGSKVLSRTALTYHGQTAEDGVITFPGGIGHVRVVAFGASGYILTGSGPTAASFRDDYNRLIDTFTSTSPVTVPTPSPTGTHAVAAALASKMIPPPSGFVADPTSSNGPITAAAFNSTTGGSNAAALHYLTGYQMTYTNAQATDLIGDALYQFASPADAATFLHEVMFTAGSGTDRALPGSGTYDDKTADSHGAYYHAEGAYLGSTVLYIYDVNSTKTHPALLREMARQQYARLR